MHGAAVRSATSFLVRMAGKAPLGLRTHIGSRTQASGRCVPYGLVFRTIDPSGLLNDRCRRPLGPAQNAAESMTELITSPDRSHEYVVALCVSRFLSHECALPLR